MRESRRSYQPVGCFGTVLGYILADVVKIGERFRV